MLSLPLHHQMEVPIHVFPPLSKPLQGIEYHLPEPNQVVEVWNPTMLQPVNVNVLTPSAPTMPEMKEYY